MHNNDLYVFPTLHLEIKQHIQLYVLYFLANLENKEIFLYLLILDYKQLFLDQQNDLVILEYDNDLQFLNMNLNLDEPKVNDNFHNNFQLQISNYNLLLIENIHNHLNDEINFLSFSGQNFDHLSLNGLIYFSNEISLLLMFIIIKSKPNS